MSDYLLTKYRIVLNWEDEKFINKQMAKVPYNLRMQVMDEYCNIWQAAKKACQDIIKADNQGRFAANQFLLNYKHN